MANNKKEVELVPSNVASGWKVKHDGKEGDKPGSGPGTYPEVIVDQPGAHLIVFKIPDNKPGTFNTTDPMWIQPGTSSPTQSGMDPEIASWAVFDKGKTLVLLDLNSKPGELYYRVKADGYAPVLDPIIKNGGGGIITPNAVTAPQADYGGSSFASRDFSGMEIGAAIFVLVAAFFVGFLVHKWFFK